MTSPARSIVVECPKCGASYQDWHRASMNLDLDDFDEDYLRDATTATCPNCSHVVQLNALIVEGDVWRLIESMHHASLEGG